MRSRKGLKIFVARLVFAAAMLALWELTSDRAIPAFFISKPSIIASNLAKLFSTGAIFVHLRATLAEAALGYILGASAGVGAALVLSRLPLAEEVLSPFLMAFYGIPRIALAPLFIIWFGIGMVSKVVVVISVVFFIAFVNTLAGLRAVDAELANMLRAMGATDWQVYRKVRVPATLPWILVGLRVGVPYALVGAIIGELLSASRGLGFLIQQYGGTLDTGNVLAVIMVLAVVVIAFNSAVGWIESRLLSWRPREQDMQGGPGM